MWGSRGSDVSCVGFKGERWCHVWGSLAVWVTLAVLDEGLDVFEGAEVRDVEPRLVLGWFDSAQS